MKRKILALTCFALLLLTGTVFCFNKPAMADESSEIEELMKAATSISITPTNKILKLQADSVYEDSFKVTNNGDDVMEFEVYASPYSYTYSEADDEYKLGYNHENSFTQIVRWITFRDKNGNYVKTTKFSAQPKETIEVAYKISTPASIPAGGQYAVLFAHTLSASTTSSGLKTEASPGLVVYGRGEGDTITESEITNLNISQSLGSEKEAKTIINGSAKVKNTGNVDFMARGELSVTGVLGRTYYKTEENAGFISVIPESERTISEKWENTPFFGLFWVTWTVSVPATNQYETISQMVLILPAPILILMILLLTFIVVWVIITVRKRKERRSKFIV